MADALQKEEGAGGGEGLTPLTLLSGFLGAGKTTLLNHILQHSREERLAVLVNDLGEVNVDASLVRATVRKAGRSIGGVVELTNGCICCSIESDLLEALLEIRRNFQPTHILIEATGVAEPKAILKSLLFTSAGGVRAVDVFRVANAVTVVDGAGLEDFLSSATVGPRQRRAHLLAADRRKPLHELLVEQIECADVLVLNKVEMLESEKQRQRLVEVLKGLNPRALVMETSFGAVDVDLLMATERFEPHATPASPLVAQATPLLNADAAFTPAEPQTPSGIFRRPNHDPYGLESLTFRARRPFDEARLLRLFRTGLPGVIRAKGYYWTTRHADRMGQLSLAGKLLRADYQGEWWHTRVERGEVSTEELPSEAIEVWLPPFGDRRQEIVFLGIGLDRQSIDDELNACFSE